MAERIVTPVGELAWVFITGQGKKDLNDNDRYVASVKYPNGSPELKTIKDILDAFWEEHKGKGWKQKSNGLKEEFFLESHAQAGEATGFTLLNFWTGIAFPDGSSKKVKTMNAKGAEVALGSKKIGSGSRGAISGAIAIYDNGVAARGITLYLNAIQLTKFVEYSDDAGFAAQEDEDGWTGDDLNAEGFPAQDDSASEGETAPADKPKVKL